MGDSLKGEDEGKNYFIEEFLAETVKSGNETNCEDSREDNNEDELKRCDEQVTESQKKNLVTRTVGVRVVASHFSNPLARLAWWQYQHRCKALTKASLLRLKIWEQESTS